MEGDHPSQVDKNPSVLSAKFQLYKTRNLDENTSTHLVVGALTFVGSGLSESFHRSKYHKNPTPSSRVSKQTPPIQTLNKW